MVTFKHSSSQSFRARARRYLPFIIIALVLLSQLERVVRVGTFFGFQVREVNSSRVTSRQNKSGSILGAEVAKKNQKSVACDTVPADKVSSILKQDVERLGGIMADKTKPYLTSSCIYRAKNDKRTVSILLRDMKDEEVAKKTITTIKSGNKDGEDIDQLGDEAFFNKSANQLTVRKGKRLITVTVPNVEGSEKDSKTIATDISKLAL